MDPISRNAAGLGDSSPVALFDNPKIKTAWRIAVALAVLAGLYATTRHHYLLFHTLAEMLTAALAGALFFVAWNSKSFAKDDAFVLLGNISLCLIIVLLLHTMAYKGMNIFTGWPGADLPTQLWIVVRYLKGLGLLAFALLIGRRINPYLSLTLCLSVTGLFLASIFLWGVFPACYVEGVGLTPFKIGSEYAVCLLLIAAGAALFHKRHTLDSPVYRFLMAAVCFSIAAGLSFTRYLSVYGFANLLGHYFHLLSFFCIYEALISSTLTRPYATLFRQLEAARLDADRRQAYYRSILDHLQEGIRVVNKDGTLMEINKTCLRINGFRREEVIGKSCTRARGCVGMERCGAGGVFTDGVARQLIREDPMPDGTTVYRDTLFSPLTDENGNVCQVIVASRDATDLVTARKAVESRLMEKNILLREVHHRVKNNLQVVSSLLSLQASKSEDREIAQALRETRNRVQSMALIHETLYASENLARIDMVSYMEGLCNHLRSSGGRGANQIQLTAHIDPCILPLDKVLPCGLILNELVANAFKHAFPGERSGSIRVEFRKADHGSHCLQVSDNGAGLPDKFDPASTRTLGLQLVLRLAGSLGGGLTASEAEGGGAVFTATFPFF